MITFIFTIPEVSPSQNVLDRWKYARQHWRVKQYRETWALCFIAKRSENRIPFNKNKFTEIKITRFSPRKIDNGNFIGGFKPALDAMRDAGLIVDDSPKWISEWYVQEKCKKGEERTEIQITYGNENALR